MTELSVDRIRQIDAKAEKWGKKYVKKEVTTSQLRKMYNDIKRAQNEFRVEDDIEKARRTLVLLKPQLAYSVSRNEEMEVVKDDFYRWIDIAVKGDERKMEMFFQLMEATVAYHAYFRKMGDDQ